MTQQQPLTLVNLPPESSAPDTPSEMPGTPTSTTTSLSTLSTTAIKDGQRGHLFYGSSRHANHPSVTSLEAERIDRISRLAGLERVSTLRAPPDNPGAPHSSLSPQTTPTSTGMPPNGMLYPAVYFDAQGQPVAAKKISTVGTASATDSYSADGSEARTTMEDAEEDILSTGTNFREAESIASLGPDGDTMDEDIDRMTNRSVGGYDDRMSDDGSASLVGFGEGAGSTISGPIYQRRPLPPALAALAGPGPSPAWAVERSNSGLSDSVSVGRRDRDALSSAGDFPSSAAALQERGAARMVDGVVNDRPGTPPDEDAFVDTTDRVGGLPIAPAHYPSQSSHPPNPSSSSAQVPAAPPSRQEVRDAGA